MTAKEYLMQYRLSLRRTDCIVGNLAELKEEAVALRDHEGRSVQLDAAVAKYVDACEEKEAELRQLEMQRRAIEETIGNVPDPLLRDILWEKYILGHTLVQYAEKSHYHYVSICRLHSQALRLVDALMPER